MATSARAKVLRETIDVRNERVCGSTWGHDHRAVVTACNTRVLLVAGNQQKGVAAYAAIVIATSWGVGGTGYLAEIIDCHGKEQLQAAGRNQSVQISYSAVLP